MATTKAYDYLNRLTSIANQAGTTLPVSYQYTNNTANQRTRMAFSDGSYWVYTYDAMGQVTSGKRYWSDGQPVAGQQFEYGFDDIGNRFCLAKSSSQCGALDRWECSSSPVLGLFLFLK